MMQNTNLDVCGMNGGHGYQSNESVSFRILLRFAEESTGGQSSRDELSTNSQGDAPIACRPDGTATESLEFPPTVFTTTGLGGRRDLDQWNMVRPPLSGVDKRRLHVLTIIQQALVILKEDGSEMLMD